MNYKINYNINEGIDLIEVLSALSHALDITEGQRRGHSFRTAFLAVELGKKLNLNQSDIFDLYCASLLKDSGCSSNASRVYKIFDADDLTSKYNVKFIDWSNFYEAFKFAIKNTKPSQNLFYKISHLLVETKGNTKLMDELTTIRCNKGFEIAISLGLSYSVANAIKFLDEHWDGNGFQIFASNFGLFAVFDIINKRKAKWFDP